MLIYLNFSKTCRQSTPQKFFAHLTADNTRASMLILDLPFRKYCSGHKTLSCVGTSLWNTLLSQIKLHRSVTHSNMILRNYFSTNLKRIPMKCLSITSQSNLLPSTFILFMVNLYAFVHRIPQGTTMKISSTIDLYYAIPSTVFFSCSVFLCLFFFFS